MSGREPEEARTSAGLPPEDGWPKASVVIPVHDGAATIGAQLDALADQRHDGPYEIVVADNGSTDATVDVVREHRANDRVKVTVVDASAGRGASVARNAAIAVATGPIICCTDADDVVEPTWIAAFVAALAPVAGEPVTAAGLIDANPLSREPFATVEHCSMRRPEGPTGVQWAYGSSMAFTKAAWELLDGFDERFVGGGEEVELYLRARRLGLPHLFVPEAVSHYRTRADRLSRFRQMVLKGEGNRALAHEFPVELSGAQRLPELSTRDRAVSVLRLFRHEAPAIALQVALDTAAIHLGELRYEHRRAR